MGHDRFKIQAKSKMLAVFWEVEKTGEVVIVTDHGKPALKITPLPKSESLESVFGKHRNAVVYHEDIMRPTSEEWP